MATPKREPLRCHEIHEVSISFNEGKFEYGPKGNPVHASQGDCIRWISDRKFAVHFQNISPCDGVDFSDGENTGKVTETAPSGSYKYIVAVEHAGRIFIDDPQVIIP